ncbi:MAG: hypothetical protein R2710_26095 [Acidimicrobiales bacterium]
MRRLILALAALRRPTGRMKTVASVLSLALLVVAVVYAIRNFPDTGGVRWPLMIGIGICAPSFTIWLNAKEFQTQALISDQDVTIAEALRISVLGTVANLLPVPGAVLVRTQALAAGGAGYGRAAKINAASGLIWLGLSGIVSGAGFGLLGSWVLAGVSAGVGLGVWALGVVTGIRHGATRAHIARMSAIEATLTIVAGLRAYGVLVALSVAVRPSQGLALAVSGAIASAAGVFPAGIGLREALSGAVATLVDLDAAVGVGAAAADRVAGLVVLFAANLAIVVRDRMAAVPTTRNEAG